MHRNEDCHRTFKCTSCGVSDAATMVGLHQTRGEEWDAVKETSDTNGRVTATDPVNTAVPDIQHEFTQT